jgi:hypothetical protein
VQPPISALLFPSWKRLRMAEESKSIISSPCPP